MSLAHSLLKNAHCVVVVASVIVFGLVSIVLLPVPPDIERSKIAV